jgi:hypothetical protein
VAVREAILRRDTAAALAALDAAAAAAAASAAAAPSLSPAPAALPRGLRVLLHRQGVLDALAGGDLMGAWRLAGRDLAPLALAPATPASPSVAAAAAASSAPTALAALTDDLEETASLFLLDADVLRWLAAGETPSSPSTQQQQQQQPQPSGAPPLLLAQRARTLLGDDTRRQTAAAVNRFLLTSAGLPSGARLPAVLTGLAGMLGGTTRGGEGKGAAADERRGGGDEGLSRPPALTADRMATGGLLLQRERR